MGGTRKFAFITMALCAVVLQQSQEVSHTQYITWILFIGFFIFMVLVTMYTNQCNEKLMLKINQLEALRGSSLSSGLMISQVNDISIVWCTLQTPYTVEDHFCKKHQYGQYLACVHVFESQTPLSSGQNSRTKESSPLTHPNPTERIHPHTKRERDSNEGGNTTSLVAFALF